jgi:hypothetical protein
MAMHIIRARGVPDVIAVIPQGEVADVYRN